MGGSRWSQVGEGKVEIAIEVGRGQAGATKGL